jgi:hypothetical protein
MSSLDSIRTQFTANDPAIVEQIETKAMLAVYINAEPQIRDDECISGLREDLPPSLLYSGKAVSGATILHRLLRNYLQLKGLVYTQSTESTRITYGLITMIYESQSDCDTALSLLRNCFALLRMRPLSISWAECSVVISCGKIDYDKSG